MTKFISLTFDVEDWFQVENFKAYIDFSTWRSFELRVKKNTEKILDTLGSFPNKPRATFFILGWVAKKLPALVKEIHSRGHEVASHGLNHHLCTNLSKNDLLIDLTDSRKLLEDITGDGILGFRAPSFAVNDAVMESIHQAGYIYDSSFNSFSAHDRYGKIDLSGAKKNRSCFQMESGLFELPVTNLKVKSLVFPLGGGGYFRLYPFKFFKLGMEAVLKKEDLFVFYAHPWEFDPDQPRVETASLGFRFRHYTNLSQAESKLKRMITSFPDCEFITCKEYIRMTEG